MIDFDVRHEGVRWWIGAECCDLLAQEWGGRAGR
jgi:hypothetical protein